MSIQVFDIAANDVQHQALLHDGYALRGQVFREGGDDTDGFDLRYRHIIVTEEGRPVGYQRYLRVPAEQIDETYTGERHDFHGIRSLPPGAEIIDTGRACTLPGYEGLGAIWGQFAPLLQQLEDTQLAAVIGCVSFHGANPELHRSELLALKRATPCPPRFRPRLRMPRFRPVRFRLFKRPGIGKGRLPAIFQTYLGVGARPVPTAFVDQEIDTLYVPMVLSRGWINWRKLQFYRSKLSF